jgi:large subunit ribosomal protein L23
MDMRGFEETAMDNTNVIIKPLITEKTTHQQTTRNAYAFEVHADANKHQIKKAVEAIYEVKVVDVRTLLRKGKPRRTKTGETHASDWKRAIVVLDENSRIELF